MDFLVQLDPRLQEVVALGVTLVVSYLILQVAKLFPVLGEYLGQYKASIVVWLTGIAVQLIQLQLNKIPANWDEVVFAAQKLLIEVILVLLAFAVLRAKRLLGYQALQ